MAHVLYVPQQGLHQASERPAKCSPAETPEGSGDLSQGSEATFTNPGFSVEYCYPELDSR